MPRTDKIKSGEFEYWTEYTRAIQEPNGSWKATASGRVRFDYKDTDCGLYREIQLETLTKEAYGKTANDAEDGALKRVDKLIGNIVTSVRTCCYEDERTETC